MYQEPRCIGWVEIVLLMFLSAALKTITPRVSQVSGLTCFLAASQPECEENLLLSDRDRHNPPDGSHCLVLHRHHDPDHRRLHLQVRPAELCGKYKDS